MTNLYAAENQIHSVTNFQDLVSTPFHGETNAICWARNLVGDFAEIVDKITLKENIVTLDQKMLLDLQLSKKGQLAREILIKDYKALKAQGADPTLNLIKCYESDDTYTFFPTDVYSFHVDRSSIPTATFLCTYHGESSEIIPNSQAEQKIHIPEIRKELKKLYQGEDRNFDSFLTEHFFDLHYQAKPQAQPLSLGLGHLWKIAIDHPESKVLPCLHRAPKEKNGQNRLLMIC